MRLLFCLFGLFWFSLSASATGEWLYYKHYPWVYDNVSKDWLYLRGAAGGEVYAYRSSTKEWEVFEVSEPTWEQKYEEWILNPEPYGGLSVLQAIKEAKESGATVLSLTFWNISDITPLAGLTNLTSIYLSDNNISDITPLAGLTNLTYLDLGLNPITASQKAILEEALPNTNIDWPDVIIDDSQETEKTWDELYEEWIQNPEPYGGLDVLQQIKEAKESLTELNLYNNNIPDITPLAGLTNLTTLLLQYNNISELTPLAGLTNLTVLVLEANNFTDITPLAGMTNFHRLWLSENQISASQKAMLEEALPLTDINW